MGWPRNLVLVRHPESEGNILTTDERAFCSTSTHEYGVNERGRRQAEITGEYLKKRFGGFDVYYVSYYVRSKEGMRIMYPEARVFEDPRLAEAQRGMWHAMTEEQVRLRFPEEIERKRREGHYHYRALGGENWPDVELRIHSFLGTLSRDCEDQNVLIVVHGNWLILFERLVQHFSIEEALRRYKNHIVENMSVTLYKDMNVNGKSRLVFSEYIVPWKNKL